MSSQTTNLGLVKMASGETIGQWSDANNGSGANLDKIDTAIGNISKLPDPTTCATIADLKAHLSSVANGMSDNQVKTIYIVTGANFDFGAFGKSERYAGEIKRLTSTQFVCSLASRFGDRIDVGYYSGTFIFGQSIYKSGDTIQIGGNNAMYAGRVGWSGKQIWFTVPLDRPVESGINKATLTNSGDGTVFACTANSAVQIGLSSFTVAINVVQGGRMALSICFYFDTAPLSITDGIVNIMLNTKFTITF